MMIGCGLFLLFGLPILWEQSRADFVKSTELLRTSRTILSVSLSIAAEYQYSLPFFRAFLKGN